MDTRSEQEKLILLSERMLIRVKEEYINLSLTSRWLKGVGQDGLQRATTLVRDLENGAWPEDFYLFEEMLEEINKPLGYGRFDTSKNLRALIAEILCDHLGISKKTLRNKTNQMISPSVMGPSYEEVQVAAATWLIGENKKIQEKKFSYDMGFLPMP